MIIQKTIISANLIFTLSLIFFSIVQGVSSPLSEQIEVPNGLNRMLRILDSKSRASHENIAEILQSEFGLAADLA